MGKFIKITTCLTVTLLLAANAYAAGDGVALAPTGNDPDDKASLQRGARNFMNYCSGCHSAKYVRYNRITRGLDLSEDQVMENLMFNAERSFETIQASMPGNDAMRWFGTAPPDMSLMARSKGTDYIYNFLRGFYLDPDSPTGVDNLYLAGTSMPHVLWELQGFQRVVFEEGEPNAEGVAPQIFKEFDHATTGTMSADEFDEFARDTANFLEYISEPIRSTRRALGVWVLAFLAFFLVLAWMLEKEMWKDVPK
jgi:ubiquinol-cytochrome c reductase cytochrome c1 subunit